MKKDTHHKRRRILRLILCGTLLSVLLSLSVFASDADTIKTLKEFNMPKNNIVSYICRWIGWALLKSLSHLVNGIEAVVYNVNGAIGNFFSNSKIQALNDTIIVIAFLLLILVVIFVGYQFIIQSRQQIAPVITNTVIGILVLITVPYMISSLYAITNSAIDLIGQGQQVGMGTQILLDNVTDVLRYDTDNFSSTDLGDKRSWYAENSSDRIVDIDVTEMVKPEDTSHAEIFGHKVGIAADGTENLTDISTTSFMWQDIPLLSERYYRWKIDWLVCFVSLIISAVALFLSCIRMAVALYELAIHGMMTEVMALLDVYTHQRMKRCLQLLVTTFAAFFGYFLILQIYLIGMNAVSSSQADVFVKIVCMFALGWMVIDGPSIFEKVMGQDLGVRSAARTLVGLRAAGALAGRSKNLITGRRTFGGGREGGLRGRIAGDKQRDPSGQVSHTGGLLNRINSKQDSSSAVFKKSAAEKSTAPASTAPPVRSNASASGSSTGTGKPSYPPKAQNPYGSSAPESRFVYSPVSEDGQADSQTAVGDNLPSSDHVPKYRPQNSPKSNGNTTQEIPSPGSKIASGRSSMPKYQPENSPAVHSQNKNPSSASPHTLPIKNRPVSSKPANVPSNVRTFRRKTNSKE